MLSPVEGAALSAAGEMCESTGLLQTSHDSSTEEESGPNCCTSIFACIASFFKGCGEICKEECGCCGDDLKSGIQARRRTVSSRLVKADLATENVMTDEGSYGTEAEASLHL